MNINIEKVRKLIRLALEEDLGQGDITTQLLVAPDEKAKAVITVKETGVVCGLGVAEEVFRSAAVQCGSEREEFSFVSNTEDGSKASEGTVIAEVSGLARAILIGERTALNFLQRLSGIATMTRKCVEEIEKVSRKTRVLDTRKTTPNLRYLEKYAVRCGGGKNHRMGLWDMILVKDNHFRLPGVRERLGQVKKKAAENIKVEVEVRNLKELKEVLEGAVDIIMLDNMGMGELKKAVDMIDGKCEVEVSGGLGLENVRELAKLGVDRISLGALTHSVKALDISLDLIRG